MNIFIVRAQTLIPQYTYLSNSISGVFDDVYAAESKIKNLEHDTFVKSCNLYQIKQSFDFTKLKEPDWFFDFSTNSLQNKNFAHWCKNNFHRWHLLDNSQKNELFELLYENKVFHTRIFYYEEHQLISIFS